ncbi:MAG: queuosine precursor transporter [Planctomycetes bacterium]|nr:queuosine precursor transporter [Planctomycetota bacterium]
MNTRSERLYLVLAALFTGSLVVANLIANKFFHIELFGKQFILSAGVIPYPLTFLVTDLLSEVYGKARANMVVLGGLAASLLVIATLAIADLMPAIDDSIVDDQTFNIVFGNSYRVIGASMIAYLVAQLIDIKVFHFWKDLTGGKHLWLRNNGSTVISQFVDSALVVWVLFAGTWTPSQMLVAILDLWLFKSLVALFDTPLFYLGAHYLPRWLKIRHE